MVSKISVKEKTGGAREKENLEKNIEQMVLMRDEASQVIMVVDASKVSSVNKVSKLTPGVIIKWQGSSRERWRGPILAIG